MNVTCAVAKSSFQEWRRLILFLFNVHHNNYYAVRYNQPECRFDKACFTESRIIGT